MKAKRLIAASTLLASAAVSSHAQITVDGFDSFNSTNALFSGTFDASRSDKLVIVATGEHGFNNATGNLNSLTYDGVPLIKAIDRDAQFASTDTIYADIWYLDNPGIFHTNGLIEVSAENRGNITAIGLSGTLEGVGNVGVTPTDTRSIDLQTTAESIVIASFSMGGAGNTANVNNVTSDAPLTQIAALKTGSNWDGQVVGYENNTAAGNQTYSFTGGNTDGSLVIAAEFLLGPPPPMLTLRVNTLTGATTMLGDPDEAVTMNYYEITSAGNSLNPLGWVSFEDADFEGNGPAGSGNGWEEAGGSRSSVLAEAYLLDESDISPGIEIDMGTAYDTIANAQDLTFRFRTDRGKIFDGLIEYFASPIGDMDGDGSLTEADISGFVQALTDRPGYAAQYPGLDPDVLGDFSGDGFITNGDIDGFVAALTSAGISAAAIPEPTTLSMLGLAGLLVTRRRRT